MSPQITRSGENTKHGQASFVKLPLDELKVGHAGLYHEEAEEDDNNAANTNINEDDNDVVLEDIPLIERTGGNTVINSEKGIKVFVKDLAKDKKNHLPNTETGVWVHYLTEGIKKDYKRTWDEAPKSIAEKAPATKKSRDKAKRIMTKKQKNELLAKMEMKYYEDDIANGVLTLEEAFASIKEAYNKKKEVEDAGYFLSENKTDGIQLFDWKGIINKRHLNPLAWRLYSSNKLAVIIPNILENYYALENKPKKLDDEVMKCRLLAATVFNKKPVGYKWDTENDKATPNYLPQIEVDGVDTNIKDAAMLKKLLNALAPQLFKEIGKTHEVVGYHLVQRRWSGEMKPRYLALDTITKKGRKHEVFIADTDGSLQTLRKES